MILKDIHLVEIKLYKDGLLLFEGKIEDLDEQYLTSETKSIDFENRTLLITI